MLVTLYLAISHVKMMPFFALTATAYCYEDIYLMFKNFRFPKWCMPALYLTLFGYSVGMLSLHDYRLMVNFKTYPVMEVEFIRANHISGKLLTNFGIGSFAAYKLYPQNRVYMDGRYEEVYNEDLMQDLSSIYTIDENFSKWGPYKTKNLHQTGIDSNRPNLYYPITCPDGTEVLPPTIWRWSRETLDKALNEGKIEFKQNKKTGRMQRKKRQRCLDFTRIKVNLHMPNS